MMKGVPTTMIAVVAVVICALAFVLVADTTSDEGGSGSDPPVFYDINYEIDASVMPSDYPTEYRQGAYVALPTPLSTDSSYFCGWYTDSDLTSPLGAITSGTEGDLNLYPMWDDDPFGKVFTFKIKDIMSGWLNNKIVEYSFKITYGQYSNGMRPIGFSITETTNGTLTTHENESYWLRDFYERASYYGNIIEQDKEMAVWTLGDFAFVVYNGYPAKLLFGDMRCDMALESNAEKFAIEYVYDESEMRLSGYVPSMYCEGLYTALPSVTSDYFFEGWFEDEAESTPIGAVLPDRSGNLHLYPGLVDGIDGKGYRMDVTSHLSYVEDTGSDNLNPIVSIDLDVSGTSEWTYVTHKDSLYYVINSVDLKCVKSMTRFGNTSTSEWNDTRSNAYWSGSPYSDVDKVYLGNKEYGGKECTVWGIPDNDCYTTVYLYRNFIPYYICSDYGRYCMEFTFAEEIAYDGSVEFHPTVIAGKGLTVDGVDDVNIGDSLTLTASGDGFIGWYEDGIFITDNKTMTIERSTPNVIYEARVSVLPYILDKDTDPHFPELHGTGYTVYDASWNVVTGDLMSDETYCIVDGCTPYSHYVYVTTGYKTVTFTWTYEGRQYSMNIDVSQADVDMATAYDDGVRDLYSSSRYIDKYFTTGDAVVREIANNLASYRDSLNLSDAQFAHFVLNFVQNMDYMTDSESRGVDEYFKYPVEYVWDGGGDCEDSSIMYSTLMDVFGYKAGIVIFKDHCMSIICADGVTGTSESVFIDKGGNHYYLCETTAPDWAVGTTPDRLRYSNETAIYVYYVG